MHRNSLLLFEEYARSCFRRESRVLEIGPDAQPSTYQKAVGNCNSWDTVDIRDRPRLTCVCQEYRIPLRSAAYDIVLAAQVAEHVKKIWVWIREVARLCKPGGTVIVIAPVSWPYHEAPVDCWRIYPEGARALFEEAGLETITAVCDCLDGHAYDTIAIARKP